MNNKMTYSSPDLELIKLDLSTDVLNVSDPMTKVTEGSGSGLGPGEDPWSQWGDLNP